MSKKAKSDGKTRLIAENRRARREYEIFDTMEAGLSLQGSEVKSLRSGHGNIRDAYVKFEGGEAWLWDAHIPTYAQAGPYHNHEPRRPRRLLMKKSEIVRWSKRVREKGLTVVALRLYFSGAWVKVEIALGKGRKLYDKRHELKKKDDKRAMERAMRG